MKIGILAVQGAFIEHEKMFEKLGVKSFEIRQKNDIEKNPPDALVLPGGESTTMGKLLRDLDLFDTINTLIKSGTPTFGTCAGLLLLAKKITNETSSYFGAMDVAAVRNAYGRQLGSFSAEATFAGIGLVPMVFIRAPYIKSVGSEAEALAEVDGKIVAARHKNMLATAFHPELSGDVSIHKYFLDSFVVK